MQQQITFTTQSVGLPAIDQERVKAWIERVALAHGRMVGPVTYIFCDDDTIIDVNRRFLNHDYYTDVITFDNNIGRMIRGDIYISLETVRSNAELQNCPYNTELHRVIIHGILHLCGINDKGPGEREIMEMHEDNALAMLDSLTPTD